MMGNVVINYIHHYPLTLKSKYNLDCSNFGLNVLNGEIN